MMTENGFGYGCGWAWQTRSKYHHQQRRVEGDMRNTRELDDLLRRKQNRPKRHLNDAHVPFTIEIWGKYPETEKRNSVYFDIT